MKNFLKIVIVYVGASFSAQRACVAYIWLLFKYAFICIPNTRRHIRITIRQLIQCCTRLAAASDKVYQLLALVGGYLRVLRLLPPLKLVAMI
jgi:hypothetical protein